MKTANLLKGDSYIQEGRKEGERGERFGSGRKGRGEVKQREGKERKRKER